MKKLLFITFLFFSSKLFAQTLKTTIDNSILGQGTKGITALKLRNTLSTMADSVSISKFPSNIIQSSSYRFVTDSEKSSWNGKLDAGSYSGSYGIMISRKIFPLPAPPYFLSNPYWIKQFVDADNFDLQFALGINQKENSIENGTISQFWRGDKTWQETSSLPISTLTQTALNSKLSLSGGTVTSDLLVNTVIKVGGSSTFENTFLGQSVLNSITSGTRNVAFGKNALTAATNGSNNTAIGYNSLSTGSSTAFNVGVGAYSLNSTTGQYNTAVGPNAGQDNTTGNYNVFIGGFRGTGYATTSNKVWISDGGGNIRITANLYGNVGIGVVDASEKLEVAGRIKITGTEGGLALPSLTTTQRDALSGVANGELIYNATTGKIQGRAGGSWVDLH